MGIHWPLAKDSAGKYVHIRDAVKANPYRCPECSARFVTRMGAKVRWHFAHYPGALCTGEGARHTLAKHFIASLLGQPISLPLLCGCCCPTKQYRIVACDVGVETPVQNYAVDVTCTIKGRPIYIEVVDTHETPTDKAGRLLANLIEVGIHDLSDEEVFSGEKVRDRLYAKLGQLLPTLAYRRWKFIHIWETPCWKCKQKTPVVMVCGGEMWSKDPELLAELKKYARVEFRRTGPVPNGYFANVCNQCGAVQGDYPLMHDLLDLANMNRVYPEAEKSLREEDRLQTIFWLEPSSPSS